MSIKADMKRVIKAAVKRGWVVLTSSPHYLLEWKDGRRVYASLTPSCSHAPKNCAADLRRVEKQVDKDVK